MVGEIYDESGNFSHLTTDDYQILGKIRAGFLDGFGFGAVEIDKIATSFLRSDTADEFVVQAGGCGLSVAELWWFWNID